tara:strand:- start:2970 stop:4157 length:1188 start_codon:yes stop_codon:yes gene_type:complete
MKSFNKEKQIIIYSNDYNGIDLNFKSNLIKKCRDYNYKPIIILTNIISSKQISGKKIKKNYNDFAEIFFLSDFTNNIPLKFLYKILDSKTNFFLKRVVKKLIVFIKYFLNSNIQKKIDKIIKNNLAVAILASNNSNIFIDKIERNFYYEAKASNVPFIGTPIVGWPIFFQKEIFNFDYYLANTIEEKNKLATLNVRPIYIGCISFDNYKNNKIKIKKNSIYFSMINYKNLFYEGFEINSHIENLINFFLKKKYIVYFKNHPLNVYDISKFNGEKNFIIYDKNLNNLDFIPDYMISILSASLLESASKNIKTIMYFPNELIESSKKNNYKFNDMYIDNKNNRPTLLRYCNLAKKISDLDKILFDKKRFDHLNENFKKDFKSQGSIDRFFKIIEYTK